MNLRDLWPWGRKSNATLDLFREIYGSRLSKTGEAVGIKEAIRCATVFACARVIATGIAQVPLKLFRELEGSDAKLPARDHPLYRVLHRKPNPWQTSYEFREMLGLHMAIAGRAYCFKTVVRGIIRELIPFDPAKVLTELAEDGISIVYKVTGKDGQTREFDQSLIWHLKGASWSGWEALDALEMAREAVGLSVAAEASQGRLHKNGVRAPGVYSVEGTLSPSQYKDLRKFLADNYAGENSGLPMIVDRGAKWLPTAMSGVDAQHVETRRFQVEEVCRAMGVMPIMVYQSDKTATYASAEAMFQAHVIHTLAPWWERIEQSIDCNLLTESDDKAGIYAKFVGQGMLRGSTKDRAEYFAKALGSGGSPAWMTQDEVRRMEEMNPMGGDASKLPIATNVPDPVDPQADAEVRAARLELAEVKAAVQHILSAPAPAPAPSAPPTINIAPAPVNFTSHAEPDMAPIVDMLHKSMAGMADMLAGAMAAAVKQGLAADPAPTINVMSADQAAPVVNVTNDVTVQPASVDLTLHVPPRKTTTDVSYDQDGNIIRTVATEKDA